MRARRSSRLSSPCSFPGLGHAYAGAYHRALGFAAPPILLVRAARAASSSGPTRAELIGLLLAPWVLPSVFVLNLVALLYRLARDHRCLPGDGLPQRGRGERRRAARAAADRLQPVVDRRPAGGDPRHVRRARRGRPLRPGRARPARDSASSSRSDEACDEPSPSGSAEADRPAGRERQPRAERHRAAGPGLGAAERRRSRRGTARSG